jgi:hypothetical protein
MKRLPNVFEIKVNGIKVGVIEVNSHKLIKNVPVITYNDRSFLPVDSWVHEEFYIYADSAFIFINEEGKKVLHIRIDHPFVLNLITLEKLKDYQSVVIYSEHNSKDEDYTIIEIC